MKLKIFLTCAIIVLCSCSHQNISSDVHPTNTDNDNNQESTTPSTPIKNNTDNLETSENNAISFEIENISDVLITLERGPCFGTCPVYKLTILGDGSVKYIGSDIKMKGNLTVKEVGERDSKISTKEIIEIIKEFEKIDYFSLQDEYTKRDYTDGRTMITSIKINGKSKTITRYTGDKTAPKELLYLENKIDEIVNSAQWIK